MRLALGILALALLAGTASADTVWTYQGNASSDPGVIQANPCSCAMNITLDFNTAGTLTAWNFTAGALTLTQTNSTLAPFNVSALFVTDLFGQAAWGLFLTGSGAAFSTGDFNTSPFEATDSVSLNGQSYLYVQGNKGSWADPVPEPGTIALLSFGFLIASILLMMRENFSKKYLWSSVSFFLLLPLSLFITAIAYIANQHDEWVERRLV
jgi:hypothetical protein